MKWIWPLSWYLLIRELEVRVAVLEAERRELQDKLRAAYLSQTALTAAYTSSVASMAASITQGWSGK